MKKVIRSSSKNKSTRNWSVKRSCPCGCTFSFEVEDVKRWFDQQEKDERYDVTCPECHKTLNVNPLIHVLQLIKCPMLTHF